MEKRLEKIIDIEVHKKYNIYMSRLHTGMKGKNGNIRL